MFNEDIPHYLLVSSTGSNPDSWFMYLRVKGECERDLKLKQLNLLSIFQPGLLRNRKDARTIEKIVQVLPFVSGIEAKDAASSLIRVAEK